VVESSSGLRSHGRGITLELDASCIDVREISTSQFIKEAMALGFSMHELMRAEQELQVRNSEVLSPCSVGLADKIISAMVRKRIHGGLGSRAMSSPGTSAPTIFNSPARRVQLATPVISSGEKLPRTIGEGVSPARRTVDRDGILNFESSDCPDSEPSGESGAEPKETSGHRDCRSLVSQVTTIQDWDRSPEVQGRRRIRLGPRGEIWPTTGL